jgi:hypothetical protein
MCSCGKLLERELWRCEYSGEFFCSTCPRTMAVPFYRVLRLAQGMVEMSSKRFFELEKAAKIPFILTEALPFDTLFAPQFIEVLKLRKQLLVCYKILSKCKKVQIGYSEEICR